MPALSLPRFTSDEPESLEGHSGTCAPMACTGTSSIIHKGRIFVLQLMQPSGFPGDLIKAEVRRMRTLLDDIRPGNISLQAAHRKQTI